MNYRSVVLHGRCAAVEDEEEKVSSLRALVEKSAPGRSREARPPTPSELAATIVVSLPIEEASAKIRSGPPLDSADLFADDCWAGELPLHLAPLPPRNDPNLRPGLAPVSVGEKARALARGGAPVYEQRRGDLLVTTAPGRLDFAFVQRFLAEESYWARGVEPEHLRTSLAQSLPFGLYRGDVQIGFARALTDYGRIAYLMDVFIAPGERGRGLGKWLVEAVLEHPDLKGIDRWLLGTLDAHGLYEKFGFVRADPGRYMVRRSRR
jgi:GNAT superfamily N-acetyltransferase